MPRAVPPGAPAGAVGPHPSLGLGHGLSFGNSSHSAARLFLGSMRSLPPAPPAPLGAHFMFSGAALLRRILRTCQAALGRYSQSALRYRKVFSGAAPSSALGMAFTQGTDAQQPQAHAAELPASSTGWASAASQFDTQAGAQTGGGDEAPVAATQQHSPPSQAQVPPTVAHQGQDQWQTHHWQHEQQREAQQ